MNNTKCRTPDKFKVPGSKFKEKLVSSTLGLNFESSTKVDTPPRSDHMFDWRQDNHYIQPEEIDVNQNASNPYVAALTTGVGLHDEFIYSMTFDEYKNFPDPFPRRDFSVREVEARIQRYPNPEQSKELFQWDIHGSLLEPTKAAIPGIAVVLIPGGPVNEYDFIFTPMVLRSI